MHHSYDVHTELDFEAEAIPADEGNDTRILDRIQENRKYILYIRY